jgi:predicted enzyme related to lactoylglutathione lyase
MTARLDLAMILVQDMPRTKAFYTELLGYEVVKEFSAPDENFLFLHTKAGGPNLALQDASVGTYGIAVEHGGLALGFAVEDADALYKEWKEKGIEIQGEVVDIGAGRMFTAKDPSGNYVQIYHLYPPVQEMQKKMGLI